MIIKDWSKLKTSWKCPDEGCEEEEDCRECVVDVSFFAESGTPVCMCGEDMEMTKVELED